MKTPKELHVRLRESMTIEKALDRAEVLIDDAADQIEDSQTLTGLHELREIINWLAARGGDGAQ